MSRLAETLGQLLPGPLSQRFFSRAEICVDNECALIVRPGNPVGSRILDDLTSELTGAYLPRFPRIPVGDSEPASRGCPYQHGDRRARTHLPPHRTG